MSFEYVICVVKLKKKMSKICPRLAIGIQNTIRTWTLRTTPFEVSKLEIVNNKKILLRVCSVWKERERGEKQKPILLFCVFCKQCKYLFLSLYVYLSLVQWLCF